MTSIEVRLQRLLREAVRQSRLRPICPPVEAAVNERLYMALVLTEMDSADCMLDDPSVAAFKRGFCNWLAKLHLMASAEVVERLWRRALSINQRVHQDPSYLAQLQVSKEMRAKCIRIVVGESRSAQSAHSRGG